MSKPPRKPDFSSVRSTVDSTEATKVDFGNVRSRVDSTERSKEAPDVSFDQPDGGRYTVVSGDTLSHIAKRFYGNANRWPRIFEANRDQLDDPDRIRPGQVLKIPDADDTRA